MARAMYILIILHICNDETCKPGACVSTCVRLIKKLALSFMIKTSVCLTGLVTNIESAGAGIVSSFPIISGMYYVKKRRHVNY